MKAKNASCQLKIFIGLPSYSSGMKITILGLLLPIKYQQALKNNKMLPPFILGGHNRKHKYLKSQKKYFTNIIYLS